MVESDSRSSRYWFRYRLRTLFVAVTLLAVCLGWQVNIVRERQVLLRDIEARRGKVYAVDHRFSDFFPMNEASIPRWRNWLGDKAIVAIQLPMDTFSESDFEQTHKVFPEAICFFGQQRAEPSR